MVLDEHVSESTAVAEQALICSESDEFQEGCPTTLWPGGTVYYRFSDAVLDANCNAGPWNGDEWIVRDAMQTWSLASNTVIKFVEQTTGGDPLILHRGNSGGFAPLGYAPGRPACLNPNSAYNTFHEIGHIIGLQHTMSRNDRDRYMAANASLLCPIGGGYGNVMGRCGGDRPMWVDLAHTTLIGNRSDYGPYEIGSIMQYGTACSAGTCDASFQGCQDGVCDVIPRGGGMIPLQQGSPTPSDISAVGEMYAEGGPWQRFRPSPSTDPGPNAPYTYQLRAGVTLKGSPTITRYIGGNVVYARGSDDGLYAKFSPERTSLWIQESVTNLRGDPAAQWRDNLLEVVVPVLGQIVYRVHDPATGWAQANLGLPGGSGTVTGVALATPRPSITVVFAIRGGELWSKRYSSATWGAWTKITSFPLLGKPAAESWGTGRIDLVARRDNNTIEHFWSNNDGTNWAVANVWGYVKLPTSPALASRTSGTLSLFMTGQDGLLHERKYANGSWGPWTMIGGLLEDTSPAAYGHDNAIFLAASIREKTPSTATTRGLWLRTYANCPAATDNGQADGFCSDICPCNEGQSDCDDLAHGTDCTGALVCGEDFGARYGFAANYDVCVNPACIATGPTGACTKDCPCGVGKNCSEDEHCLPHLTCNTGTCWF